MLIIIVFFLFIIYALTVLTRPVYKLSPVSSKIIRVCLFTLSPVLITLLTISHFNIYPRGYWFTKGIFWVVIFLIMILFGLGDKSVLSKIEKFIYGVIFYLPLAFIPFLLIPFIGLGTGLIFYASFIGDKSFVLYSDENIRVQKQGIRFMGPDPPLEIYLKDGLFSYKDAVLRMGYNDIYDSLRVRRINDSTYSLIHYAPGNWQIPDGFEEFKYSYTPK